MAEEHPPTQYPEEEIGSQGISVGSFVLSLVPPLAPIGLVLGVIALSRGAPRKGYAIAALAIAPLSAVCCLGVVVFLPALGKASQVERQLKSAAQIRLIGQGLAIYASTNDNWYPEVGADWEQRLIDAGLVVREIFAAPRAQPGQQSYFYIPGHRFDLSEVPLLYENPDLWRGRGGHVYFGDGRVEWVGRREYALLFERLEAERLEAESGRPTPARHGGAGAALPPHEAVHIISRGMELAGAPTRLGPSVSLGHGVELPQPAVPGPPEGIVDWRMTVINRTDRQIDDVILSITGTTHRQVVSALPPEDVLLPRALRDVIVPVKLSPGAPPSSLHFEAVVVGVRFGDGSAFGDAQVLAAGAARVAMPDPGRAAPRAGAERGQAPEISPFAAQLLVRRAEVSVMEASYGAGEMRVDVRSAVEAWLDSEDWPSPLRVAPSALGVADPAPGAGKTLRVRLEAGPAAVTAEAEDGEWLLVGGPGSLGLGPVAPTAPVELEGMRILAAWYGHMGRWVNALPALRERVDESGRIETRASNSLVGLDPAIDIRKSLLLYYERDGAMWQASYPENAPVALPLGP